MKKNMPVECRSALYMPASNSKALAKGPALDADAIIIDLEDSVAPEVKETAREQAVMAFNDFDYDYRLRVLRINAADTIWYNDDIEAAARCVPHAVVLPKVESVDDIAQLSQAMDRKPSLASCALWAMMESPLSVVNATAIAASRNTYPRLSLMIVGNNDMVRVSGMAASTSRQYLLPWMMTLIGAAKAFDLQILDGVFNDFRDIDGLTTECIQGAAMGMDGKTLIHPSQLSAANNAFSPSTEDVDQAREIVAAFAQPEHSDKGAISINGRMIERLHLHMAEQLLLRAARIAQRG